MTPLPANRFSVNVEQDIFHIQEKQRLINKIGRVVWNILSVIIFPIGLARLALKGVRHLAASMILPATKTFDLDYHEAKLTKVSTEREKKRALPSTPKLEKKIEQLDKKATKLKEKCEQIRNLSTDRVNFLNAYPDNAEQITILTADDVQLDTFAYHHSDQKKLKPADQKWIIHFGGNGECYEGHLETAKYTSGQTGASVYCGNYRGVFRSEGIFRTIPKSNCFLA